MHIPSYMGSEMRFFDAWYENFGKSYSYGHLKGATMIGIDVTWDSK